MFELIESNNVEGVHNILSNMNELTEEALEELLIGKDDNGRTLLHAAIDKGSLEITKELLLASISVDEYDGQRRTPLHVAVEKGFTPIIYELLVKDASLSKINNEGETALQMAKALYSKEKGNNYLKIVALLSTRQEFQQIMPSLKFNRTIHLIEKIASKIEPARGKDKILFIGTTGSGKSTLLNYLNGTRYERKRRAGRMVVNRVDGVREVAKVGTKIFESETLYPQVIQKENLDFVYCDLAGLFDSRGDEEQICAASSFNMLSQLEGGIKGIMVFLDIPGLTSLKGDSFKRIALALSKIINGQVELMRSIQFVITKTEGPCTPKEAMDNFIVPLIRDLVYGGSVEVIVPIIEHLNGKNILSEQALESYIEILLKSFTGKLNDDDLALLNMLVHMDVQQIIIPDICDNGESCDLIEAKLCSLPLQSAGVFNFLKYDALQEKFVNLLENMAQWYLGRMSRIESLLPKEIENIKKDRVLTSSQYAEIKKDICTKNDELLTHNVTIYESETIISELQKQLNGNLTMLEYIISLGHDSRCEICRTNKDKLDKMNVDLRKGILEQEKTKSDIRCKIAIITEEIKKLDLKKALIEKTISEFNKQIIFLENDIKNILLELTVNQDLFEMVYKLTHILNLKYSENIIDFWKKHKQKNAIDISIMEEEMMNEEIEKLKKQVEDLTKLVNESKTLIDELRERESMRNKQSAKEGNEKTSSNLLTTQFNQLSLDVSHLRNNIKEERSVRESQHATLDNRLTQESNHIKSVFNGHNHWIDLQGDSGHNGHGHCCKAGEHRSGNTVKGPIQTM